MKPSGIKRPIGEGLLNWPSDEPQLIAGRCRNCGSIFFPAKPAFHHPDCKGREVEETLLSRHGKLISYTIHHYQPPLPFRMEPFQPYAIGVAELPEKLQVVGMLCGLPNEELEVGQSVELVTERLYDDDDGNEVHTWKWKVLRPEAREN